jgi:ATP-dependent DNA ligase
MEKVLNLPTLYHKGRTGAIYQWKTWADGGEIYTEYGQVGGQMQISCKQAESKNVGKSNETTPAQQAELEVKALHTYKLERKYFLTPAECVETQLLSPMLAPGKEFSETKKYLKYPCDAQPKLDGNRCLAYWENGQVALQTRGGKFWDLPHIAKELEKFLPEDAIFDGELYIHGESCQTITSYLKKYKPGLTETVQFHVYDVPTIDGTDQPWSVRRQYLFDLSEKLDADFDCYAIDFVPTISATCEEDIITFQAYWIENGYEGAMARNLHGMYEWGYRSKNLLKVKTFDDHEYQITGYFNGRGKNETTVTWECITPEGIKFTVAPTGNKKDREEMLTNAEQHIGKLLKVKHFGLTDDLVPRFPVGIAFRENND